MLLVDNIYVRPMYVNIESKTDLVQFFAIILQTFLMPYPYLAHWKEEYSEKLHGLPNNVIDHLNSTHPGG